MLLGVKRDRATEAEASAAALRLELLDAEEVAAMEADAVVVAVFTPMLLRVMDAVTAQAEAAVAALGLELPGSKGALLALAPPLLDVDEVVGANAKLGAIELVLKPLDTAGIVMAMAMAMTRVLLDV